MFVTIFVGNEKKGGHLDQLLHLEKSMSVYKKACKSSYFLFIMVYLSRTVFLILYPILTRLREKIIK